MSISDVPQAAPAPAEMREIPARIDALRDTVCELEAQSSLLASALCPVMRPSHPTAVTPTPAPPCTPIGEAIENLHMRCHEVVQVLRDARDRLEL